MGRRGKSSNPTQLGKGCPCPLKTTFMQEQFNQNWKKRGGHVAFQATMISIKMSCTLARLKLVRNRMLNTY